MADKNVCPIERGGRGGRALELLESRRLLAAAVQGVGAGLVGHYFNDATLNSMAMTRIDPVIDFHFGQGGAPGGGMSADDFSARWSGKVQAQFSETYSFYTQSDQPVRLWVNGQQVVNNWADHPLAEDSGTITLSAGEFYDIKLETASTIPDADLKLSWSSASTSKQVIPASQLYDSGGWVSQNWLSENIGAPIGGAFALGDASGYSITVGGGDFGIRANDNFHFLHQTLNGDGTILAKVTLQQDYEWPSEAGLMIRESSDPASKFVAVTTGAGGSSQIQSRKTVGALGVSSDSFGAGAQWLKLVRDGSFFKAYYSVTGTEGSWTLAGTTYVDMGRTVQVGLAGTAGFESTPLTANFANVSVSATVPLGAGLDQVRDYSLGNVFVDVSRQMRQPQNTNFSGNVPTDANGWATTDFGIIFITGYSNANAIYKGTYKLSFKGQATLGKWVSPATISNVVYVAATNTTTADVFIDPPNQVSTEWNVGLTFSNTKRTSTSPVGSGVTDIKLIRPGYAASTTQVFTNEYLEHLKQFTTLRFMDFVQTNNNPVANWSDRAKATDIRQSTDKGVAWEYVIQIANQLKKDVWINIPHLASDDYVRNLAQLFKSSLNKDLTVYVEYSNEVWNGMFQQADWQLNQAIAEVNAGNSPLNNDGSDNQYYWMWRRTAKRIKEVGDIFGDVFGRESINRRVRPVLSMQTANPEVIKQGLEFLDRTYGSPSNYIYGIAGAPYFGAGELESVPGASVDQYITSFGNSIDYHNSSYYTYHSFVNRYGLKFLSYEGGPDTFGWSNIEAKKQASLDPRMAGLVEKYLDGWYSQGGALFNWFQAGPTNWDGPYGTWGLTNAINNLTSPKILGTITVVSTPKEQLSYGIPVPSSFDARMRAGTSAPYSDPYLKSPGKGNSVDYFVRANKAGNYKLTLRGGTAGSNEQIATNVNTTMRTITLKNTGSSTNFTDNVVGTVQLEEGINSIRLTSVNESSGWNLQTVTVAAADVANSAPTVVNPANASPSSVNGKVTSLSVLGADDGGENKLTYSWRAVGEPVGVVVFSANGSNAAKNTLAQFTRTGAFTLECTISDGTSSVISSVVVTVNQVVQSITISPNPSNIMNGGIQQFTAQAFDQYGLALKVQPAFFWSMDGGGIGSITSSGLYTAPGSGTGNSVVRATVSNGVSGAGTVVVQLPRTPENPSGLLPGIDYKYYEGTWSSLPNFDALTPVKKGTISTINRDPRQRDDWYGFVYSGFVTVPTTGTYTFYTASDDGSRLYIGNSMVVDNDGSHGNIEKSGQIVLAAGTHAIKVTYFEGQANDSITVSYAGPGVTKKEIPASALFHTRPAPTVATAASANPNPVTGTTTNLSVLGADEGGEGSLSYTWAATAKPAGAGNPTFSVNGTNGAKNTTATFSMAGAYTFQVTISNGFFSTSSSVNVTVSQTPVTLNLDPSQASMAMGAQQQIVSSGRDQFGYNISPVALLTWSVVGGSGNGTISSSGVYTSPLRAGTYTVSATRNGLTASTQVNVADTEPVVVEPASAVLNAAGTAAQLHARATDDGGAANLQYSWWVEDKPAGAPEPMFSVNGSANAGDPIVTFSQAGTYLIYCGIYDGQNPVYTSVVVNVNQRVATVSVNPASVTLTPSATQQYTASARDQFGNSMSGVSFTWDETGEGWISTSGLYTAWNVGGTVTATASGVSGSASVTVNNQAPTVATPAWANPETGSSIQVALGVLGADDNGEANLVYNWATTAKPQGAQDPTFSVNGTNGAKNTIASFHKAGTYTFVVTIGDGNKNVTSSVTATVQQKTTTVVVTPGSVGLGNGQTQQFTASAKDQFGDTMAAQPNIVWSASVGAISSSGLYTAPSSGSFSDIVTAHAVGQLSGQVSGTATVSFQQTSAFTNEADIGLPGIAGSSSLVNGTYTVRGSGADIWDWEDHFHFVYRQLSGDATIIAQVTGIGNTNEYAKAGVMFREDLQPQAKAASLVLDPSHEIALQTRFEQWGDTYQTPWESVSGPYWLKLTRSGNTFTAYTSTNGTSWIMIGSESVSMNSTILVGLAVTSHDDAALNTSTFTNVSVTGGAPPAPMMSAARSIAMSGLEAEASSMGTGDGVTPSDLTVTSESTSSPARPAVKVNVPLVSGATGKAVVRKPATVRINVPVIAKIKRGEVPDVQTH